jgi:D-alanyl-D-alanine carboxypeptidase/D-alanyl-D-alanine-endopeptidase (penicillin-binding protein 4)
MGDAAAARASHPHSRVGFPVCAALLAALCTVAGPVAAADRPPLAQIPKPVAAGAPWTAAELGALRASLDALLAQAPALRGAHAGIIALETRSGTALYERNSGERFLPASTAKLVTGSVALARLGPGFRFTTEVRANGPLVEGELQGDLVLRGGGDPLLGAADLDDAAAAVARAGVRRIAGDVRIDSSYFEAKHYGDGWSVDDIPFDYMPVLSALSLDENAVHLTVAPGANAGDPALVHAPRSLVPILPANAAALPAGPCGDAAFPFRLVNRATTSAPGAQETLALSREPCATIAVSGAIPRGSALEELDAAVPDPEAYALAVFRAALAARGITLGPPAGGNDAPAAVLWTHASEPLSELLAGFWYPSDNLIGEALLRSLGAARGGPPGTDAAGLALEREQQAAWGIPPRDIDLADGSGLSRYDLATPRALAGVLQADWNGPYRDLILDALPVAGVRGTLAHAFIGTPLERRVFAKSGSMTHVSALAGYLATERHGAVTFAILVDDALGGSASLEDLRARVLARFATD